MATTYELPPRSKELGVAGMEKPTPKEAGCLGCYAMFFLFGICVLLGRNLLIGIILFVLFDALLGGSKLFKK